MTALRIAGLDVDLGGRPVLRGVDLSVAAGELVGLLGPNGAGKTTLLRSVLGLIPTAGGEISVAGAAPRRGLARIGYVPQRHEFAWDFPISVEYAVLSGRARQIGWLRRAGVEDYRAANAALERVGMSSLRGRPVGELSGGQRQRVLVARALARGPAVLLLDEPFTGLDLPTQDLLNTLFGDLAGEGRAVLMTTHDLGTARYSCTRLCLLNRTVLADGPPGELLDPRVWSATFGIPAHSPLLRALGLDPVLDPSLGSSGAVG